MGTSNPIESGRGNTTASSLSWEVMREEGLSLCISAAERALIYLFSVFLSTPTPFSSVGSLVSSNYSSACTCPPKWPLQELSLLQFPGGSSPYPVNLCIPWFKLSKKRHLFVQFICPSHATRVIHTSLVRE